MFKASINGPNRRKNRVGSSLSTPETTKNQQDQENVEAPLRFRVKPSTDDNKPLEEGHACYFTASSVAGKELIRQHQLQLSQSKVTQQEGRNDPILIHFHDIPVFVLRAIPIDEQQTDTNPVRKGEEDVEDSIYKVTCCSRPSTQKDNGDYDELAAVEVEVLLRNTRSDKFNMEVQEDSKHIYPETPSFSATSIIRIVSNAKEALGGGLTSAEASMDEPYRGKVAVNTEFYVTSGASEALSHVTIEGERKLPTGQLPEDVIHVTTSDLEWFPVRRVLLAPCIKLTRYVQAGRGKYVNDALPILSDEDRSDDAPIDDNCPHCKVPIDCCTFDRILLFIMSLLYPSEYKFDLNLSEVNAMADAAEALGLQPLIDLCTSQSSSFDSRVRKDRYIRFAEVKRRNDQGGELLILLDGMVLDITRWLEEHPGGPSIIPSQALNMDCTVFFEMYHVSRQSFLYLKSFYIGELSPEDHAALSSSAEGVSASDAFLQSLRSYTSEWRVKISENVSVEIHKSF
eukprot:scaffold33712_cov57-Attheya_sp.AAC.4